MPTRITQIERPKSETLAFRCIAENGDQPDSSVPTVFKVEGTLNLSDAELLEKICRDVGNESRRPVTLKLDELSYLDSESAAVLCRMKREQNVTLDGLHLFIEKVIELTEESEKVTKYLPKPDSPVE